MRLAADSSSLRGNELYEPRRLRHFYYGNLYRKSQRAALGLHASFQHTCVLAAPGPPDVSMDQTLELKKSEGSLVFSLVSSFGPSGVSTLTVCK